MDGKTYSGFPTPCFTPWVSLSRTVFEIVVWDVLITRSCWLQYTSANLPWLLPYIWGLYLSRCYAPLHMQSPYVVPPSPVTLRCMLTHMVTLVHATLLPPNALPYFHSSSLSSRWSSTSSLPHTAMSSPSLEILQPLRHQHLPFGICHPGLLFRFYGYVNSSRVGCWLESWSSRCSRLVYPTELIILQQPSLNLLWYEQMAPPTQALSSSLLAPCHPKPESSLQLSRKFWVTSTGKLVWILWFGLRNSSLDSNMLSIVKNMQRKW